MTSDARIEEAARWLLERPRDERGRPVVIELKERFGLSVKDACEALAAANPIKESNI